MDLLYMILQKAIDMGATDIHLSPNLVPVFRIKRKLNYYNTFLPLNDQAMLQLVDYFERVIPSLKQEIIEKKQSDFSYEYKAYRFRVNLSYSKGLPVFSIRVIPNGEINVMELGLGDIIRKMKRINAGLILITGKVNSGKTTTLNAYIQEVNKEQTKKIVTLEDPIEYLHKSDKCMIIQKEIGKQSDVNTYYDGLINLLREDSDITVLGEIRDLKTMNVAIDLAESGGLVIGTLHTRSCGETVERIVNMYNPQDQSYIKNSLSSVLKMVVSQKLLVGKDSKLLMVPEIMIVNSTIAAEIRQADFSINDIEDSIHSLKEFGCVSYEHSFAKMYLDNKISMKEIEENLENSTFDLVKKLIVNMGGSLEE